MRSRYRRHLSAAFVLLSLAALSGAAPGMAGAAAATTVVSGQLVDGSGHPIGGAWVNLYAMPTTDGTVTPVAGATTDANGNYTVQVPDTTALQALAAANGGYVNFETQIDSPSLSLIRDFAMTYANGSWAPGRAQPSHMNGRVRMAAGAAGVAKMRSPAGITPNIGGPDPCLNKTFTTIDTRDNYTTVGEVHTAGDSSEVFTYGKSADTDTDVAIGLAAGTGPWSITGSVHLGDSSQSGSDVTWRVGALVGHRTDSQFHYVRQKVHYVVSECPADYQTIKATGWDGGALGGDDNSNLDHNCNNVGHETDFGPGTGFHRYQNNMVKFSASVVAFGIELGTQSGWSQYVDSKWTFNGGFSDHYLCGSDGAITVSHRIYAGA